MAHSLPSSMAVPVGEKLRQSRLAKGLSTREEDILDSAVGKGLLTWEDAAKVMCVPVDELHLRMRIALGRGEDTPSEGGDDEDGSAILSFNAR